MAKFFNLVITILIVISVLVLFQQGIAQAAQSPAPPVKKAEKKEKKKDPEVTISAEDTRKLLSVYNNLSSLNMQEESARQAYEAAKARKQTGEANLESLTQYLGRIYGFDPQGKTYRPNEDGTAAVISTQQQPLPEGTEEKKE
jgi:Na+-transporting methylmalonyl-CoA/oxaloacetate decarboxylase gamma subunit